MHLRNLELFEGIHLGSITFRSILNIERINYSDLRWVYKENIGYDQKKWSLKNMDKNLKIAFIADWHFTCKILKRGCTKVIYHCVRIRDVLENYIHKLKFPKITTYKGYINTKYLHREKSWFVILTPGASNVNLW